MSKEIAYQVFSSDAAWLANLDPRKPWFLGGDFFKRSDSGRLELEWDPQQFNAAVTGAGADPKETIDTLRLIVHDAVMQAIQRNGGLLGGLIMDEIRDAAA